MTSAPSADKDVMSGLGPDITWGARGGRRASFASGRSPSFMSGFLEHLVDGVHHILDCLDLLELLGLHAAFGVALELDG